MLLLFWMTFSVNFLCKDKRIINVFLQIKKKKAWNMIPGSSFSGCYHSSPIKGPQL